ncbi:Pentatricopeptide repeat-containing protein At1g30610, chloroplastic [Linum grandiflorum]
MEMPVIANRQMGLPHPETSCSCKWIPDSPSGFLNSRQPFFSVPASIKRRNRFGRMRVNTEKDSQGVVEKELGFKPSFGEYLKVMERVKTGRERKLMDNLKDMELKGDGAVSLDQKRADLMGKEAGGDGGDGRNGNFNRFKGFSGQEKAPKSSFRSNDKLPGSDGGDYSGAVVNGGKLVDDRNMIRRRNDVSSNIRFDANVERKIGGKAMDGKALGGRNSRMNIVKVDKMENVERNSVVVGDGNNRESSNGAWVRKKNVLDNVGGSSGVVGDVMVNGSSVTIKERDSDRESSSGAWVRKRNVFEGKEVGVRPEATSYRPVVNFLQVKEITPIQKNGMLREKKWLHRKNGGDSDLKVERAAFKTLEDPEYVVRRIPASKREVEDKIQKLASCLNGAEIDVPEWMFSKMMRSARIKYTDHNVLRLIQILGKLGNWRRVLQIIEWLQMRDRFKSHNPRYIIHSPSSPFIYTTALHVLGKARRPVEALNLFYSMQKRVSTYPDLVAYHSIAVTLGQAGYMKELFDVIDSMQSAPKKKNKEGFLETWDPRLEPDVVVYNAVLNACVRRKQWEGAFWVLQQLKGKKQKPSTATYGLVMEVMFVCEKYNLVHEFFRKLKKACIPDALAYRVLVNTLSKESKPDEAVLAVQEMESRGIVGSAALYYDLARCHCSAGRCEEALAQVDKICRVANKPLVVTYTGLIQACLEAGRTEDATYIFNHMKQFCSPNLVTCNILLKGYLDHGRFEEARSLFDNMLDYSTQLDNTVRVVPDIYSFNTMLEACVSEQRWDDFGHVYETMLQHGHHFNAKRHVRFILEAARGGKEEVVEITWKHLARFGRVPPPPIIKERFCRMLAERDCDSALECVAAAATDHEESPAFNRTAWSNLLKDNSHRFSRETVIQLLHKAKLLVSGNDDDVVANSLLNTLVTVCGDFLRTSMNK